MVVNKFQSESAVGVKGVLPRFEATGAFSEQSLATVLNSVLLGFIIRKNLTYHDLESLQLQFAKQNRIMIVTENKCIYPVGDNKGECSLCVVLKEDQINVCDLLSKHTELVDIIEDAWPSLLDAAAKTIRLFSKSSGAVLINRSSARVIATSKNLTALTGFAQSDFEGKEYGKISRKITTCITGKKLTFENFNAGGLSLCQVSIDAPTSSDRQHESSNTVSVNSPISTHKLIEEPDTIGLHFSRFNALLRERLHMSMSPETITQIESVVSELLTYDPRFSSLQTKACLRLLIQSLFMAHNSIPGATSGTNVSFDREKQSIEFETPLSSSQTDSAQSNEWFKAADGIASKIGIDIGEMQKSNKSIINRINLTKERI